MSTQHDYTQYEDKSNNSDALAQLAILGDELMEAQAQEEAKAEELKKAQDKVRDLSWFKIPQLMEELGLELFKTKGGMIIEVKEDIRASIPSAFRSEAFGWLRNSGNGSLIKRVVEISFGKGQDEKAKELIEELQAKGLPVEDKENVHASTLAAFCREKLAAGEDIPMDLLGVFRQRVAKFNKGRKTAGKKSSEGDAGF